jgi:drug/metabolite transporter (DMT)-like permease
VARGLNETLPPFGLAFWRWTLSVSLLLPFVAGTLVAQRRLVARHWKLLVGAGVFGVAGYNSLVYLAMQTTPALNVSLINSAMPLAIPIAAMIIVRERVVAGQWLGLGISFLGVLWIVARGDPATLAAFRVAPGDLWVLVAVVNWAIYSSLLRFKPPEMSPGVLMISTMAVGTVVLAPFMLVEAAQGRTVPLEPHALAAVGYVAVFASLVAYLCWNRSVALLGPTRTGLAIHLMPVLVGVLAFLILGEPIEGFHLGGAAFIGVGIVLAMRAGRTRPPAG